MVLVKTDVIHILCLTWTRENIDNPDFLSKIDSCSLPDLSPEENHLFSDTEFYVEWVVGYLPTSDKRLEEIRCSHLKTKYVQL